MASKSLKDRENFVSYQIHNMHSTRNELNDKNYFLSTPLLDITGKEREYKQFWGSTKFEYDFQQSRVHLIFREKLFLQNSSFAIAAWFGMWWAGLEKL